MTASKKPQLARSNTSSGLLPYDPEEYPREIARHYISASDSDIAEMMDDIGLKNFNDLFSHFPQDTRFSLDSSLPPELSYNDACVRLQ